MKEVIIAIPVYHLDLQHFEREALANNIKVLGDLPIVFLKPRGLDLSVLKAQYPHVGEIEVPSDWLGETRGIVGYNEMMMSADFYQLFSEYRYLLICHLDAWMFRNEVLEWCAKDYDHVAAPWPMRHRYRHFPLKQIRTLRLRFRVKKTIIRWSTFGHIGNGGFSLRKVDKFHDACLKYASRINYYNKMSFNEDIFWAFVPKELAIPSIEEAMLFAFDNKPAFCYSEINGQLPMACHGFNKPDRIDFWRQFIPRI